MLDEEDDVIKQIKLKRSKNEKVEVNIRKDHQDREEDHEKKPKAGLDRLKEFKLNNEEEDKIFQNAIEVSNVINSPGLADFPKRINGLKKLSNEVPERMI